MDLLQIHAHFMGKKHSSVTYLRHLAQFSFCFYKGKGALYSITWR